jgi:hypothetical protein
MAKHMLAQRFVPSGSSHGTLGLALFVALIAPACAPESVAVVRDSVCEPSGCAPAPAEDGDDPAKFCDDHNPCTTDANCTPCTSLPPEQRDIYHCTADIELPGFCEGKTGCVHVAMTTPGEKINTCFPVAGDADLHSGVCRAGTCAENPFSPQT